MARDPEENENNEPQDEEQDLGDEPQISYFNGIAHEICSCCGSVAGHGCPTSEPCNCESMGQEAEDA